MASSRIDGSLVVTGTLTVGFFPAPTNSVGNSAIRFGDLISAEKLEHQKPVIYAQTKGVSVAAEVGRTIHVNNGACEVIRVAAGFLTAGVSWTGNATIDIKRNGTTILSTPLIVPGATAAFTLVDGTVTPPGTFTANSFFEVSVTVTTGTGTLAQGLVVMVWSREAAE